MNTLQTYLKSLLIITGCLLAVDLYAVDEMADEEGMLEEEVETLPPLYTSEIEFGVGYSSSDSFKFGEYNGLEDQGAFAIGNITLRKFSAIGDGDNNYWELTGKNLGLDPRNIYAEYDHDGTYGNYSSNRDYRVFFEYDQIPHNQFEDGFTPFFGAGTTNQTLPSPWGGTLTSTDRMDDLLTSLKNVELETERQRFGGGIKWHFTDQWLAQVNYRHEIKEGSDPIGAIFGTSGGDPRSSILAVPINYDTDEFDASLSFQGEKAQYSLNYHLSVFDNNDTSVFWENPFVNSRWDAGASNPDGIGRLSLFPDNIAHQVQLSGGYNFTPRTRGTATVSYSRWLQDDAFLPYTNLATASIPVALPRADLDGDIEKVFANFNLYSRVTNKLSLKARYTYDDRSNNTPRNIYLRMQGDAQADQPTVDDDNARINWTYDLTRHLVELDGDYRLTAMTKLQLGYAYERKERNQSEVETTDEHTGKIRLSSTFFDSVTGWIKYQHSVRDGSDYISNQPFLTGHTQEHIDDEIASSCGGIATDCPGLYENNPFIRKFHLADRDRDRLQGALVFYPTETVDFNVNGEYRDDDYDDTELGLQDSQRYNVTLDMGYHPSHLFNAYVFGSYEVFKYDQRGFRRARNAIVPNGGISGIFDLIPSNAGADFWTTDTKDRSYTLGTGIDWYVIEDKFKVNLDVTYSRTSTHFKQAGGPLLTGGNVAEQLPDVTTRLLNLSLTGEYSFKENMKARFGYTYERYKTRDFGLDNVNVNTLSNVILLGNSSPDYVAHVFGISFVYEFQ